MKRIFFFCCTTSFILILSFAVACKKESTTPTTCQNCGGGGGTYSTHTVMIAASQWAATGSAYTFSFTVPQNAISFYADNQNQEQQLSSSQIDYLGGKLWLNIYGNEAVLSYSSTFHEKPGKLTETIIKIKVAE